MARNAAASTGQREIAVIGAGVAGLTAAHILQKNASVTLYEADDRLGGHADTHEVVTADAGTLGVDTGFIVHNEKTYPTLLRLFAELGVTTQDSEMSMSIRCEECGLEYAGAKGAGGMFAQARSLVRPRFLKLLVEVKRFHRNAQALLAVPADAAAADETLREFLARGRYSTYFTQHFMTPVVSCVWSCAPEIALEYPARYLFSFLENHGMLSVTGSPQWRTVVGGSHAYVQKAAKNLTAVHTSTPVTSVRRVAGKVEVVSDAGKKRYDAVVIATHPNQALRMLAKPTALESELLGAFEYSQNPTVLHGDATLLPSAKRAQASWNYRMDRCATTSDKVLVSYDMRRLQRLGTNQQLIVTLNPEGHVDPSFVLDSMSYEHPIYTPQSVAAQRRLPELNDGLIAFAGAYHGWGFHEDGARSGAAAATSVGGSW